MEGSRTQQRGKEHQDGWKRRQEADGSDEDQPRQDPEPRRREHSRHAAQPTHDHQYRLANLPRLPGVRAKPIREGLSEHDRGESRAATLQRHDEAGNTSEHKQHAGSEPGDVHARRQGHDQRGGRFEEVSPGAHP